VKKPAKRKCATSQTGVSDPATKRPAFFDGRLLTQEDFAGEQNYDKTHGRRPVRRPAVISDKVWRELQRICACIRKERSCCRVLFINRNKKGNLLAACALARGPHLPLYRIDVSELVNKYIGETEKNLARVFDRAEEADAILFFDEADALFTRRSEVKDSHDRYANIEFSYLLQRLEKFNGIAILAIRRSENLDAAFLRRFNWIVSFGENKPSRARARKQKNRRSTK